MTDRDPAPGMPPIPSYLADPAIGESLVMKSDYDLLRAYAESQRARAERAIDLLKEIDATGILYANNLEVDARVANFLNEQRADPEDGK